jgi:signal recognition particle subunit SRP54
MFEQLTSKFEDLFYRIRNKGKLSPGDLERTLREIKLALLEADVNFKVVKEFLSNLEQKALGSKIMESLTPAQQIIKIVNDEMIRMLGSTSGNISFAQKGPTIVMMLGLQGTGKTSSVIKLANYFKTKHQKKVSVVAADVYRPAAVLQLQDMAETVDVEVYSGKGSDPAEISRQGVKKLTKTGSDVIIIDTAGRLQIDEKMMDEAKRIRNAVKPHQVFLVLDAMTGQEAVNIAYTFNSEVECDGIILTKLDSDTRGGAALSVYYVVKKPIKFISSGEKIEDFDIFYPERIASRILGKGDVLTLIEKAEKVIDEKRAEELYRRIEKQEFNFEDFIVQLKSIKKMGSFDKILSMLPIPGAGKALKKMKFDQTHLDRMEAIISSMTVEERKRPSIIDGSRKKRIARGSGSSANEVNRLLKQFSKTRQMMKQLTGIRGKLGLPFGDELRF